MNRDHAFMVMLGAGIVAVLLWRFTPAQAAPVDTAVDLAKGTMGRPTAAPTVDAAFALGMSYGPDDGVAGPVWYTVPYPGTRPTMPPIPPATK
jgi:hypothetical protein